MGNAPNYLINLLKPYNPPRSLRSSNTFLLQIPKSHTKISDSSFEVFAPKEWNKLPLNIRSHTSLFSFKRDLKTHLFKEFYGDLC